MALFFDQTWFDAALAEVHLTRDAVAAALGLSRSQIDEVWKDQRELTAQEVSTLAVLLGQPADEIVRRGGIATPLPAAGNASVEPTSLAAIEHRLQAIEDRLTRIEMEINTTNKRLHKINPTN